jgi:O-glycosyl hydrolase
MISRIIRIAAASLCVGLAVCAGAQTTDSINFGTTYQTIRGFGTATAWQPVLNSTQANNLFGIGQGEIGLTILRSRIDPSSTTGGANWQTELQNAQQAQSINSQVIVFATPWTPPAAWKSNNSTIGGTLNTGNYAAFANYLNAFVAYEKAGGVNLYAISVQNEPDFLPGTYESCSYSGAQMDAFVAQEGGTINTRLMMPESDSFNLNESDPTLNDSNAVGHVSIVAGHTYGVNPFYYTNAKNKGKDVWMTETTYTPAGGSNAQPTISDAISAAKLYHQSMAVAQYNAYVYWWTPLLLNGNSPNYYAYALGQYSKFVRPGYVMTGANNNPTSGVYVTSYKGNNNYVIVAVNSNSGSSSINFSMSGATLTSMIPYQTSASYQLTQQGTVSVSNNSFTYPLPGQSITTFVGTSTTCEPTTITPYISVSGTWTQESSASVPSTTTAVNLGPQPLSGGSWSWAGPNGFTSTAREIDNIPLSAGSNVYTATYTNSCGAKSTQAFTITAPGGSGSPINIDAGGAASGSWAADEDFSGGTALTYTNSVSTSLLSGTIPPQTVLQSQRYGSGSSFTYTIPGYTSGSSHTVTLYFVENYVTGSGQREFNVLINGTQVLTNYDVYAAAGGQFKAVQRSFTTNANSSGQFVVQFNPGAIQNSMVSGIAIQ